MQKKKANTPAAGKKPDLVRVRHDQWISFVILISTGGWPRVPPWSI
jgi:hypothetical protein